MLFNTTPNSPQCSSTYIRTLRLIEGPWYALATLASVGPLQAVTSFDRSSKFAMLSKHCTRPTSFTVRSESPASSYQTRMPFSMTFANHKRTKLRALKKMYLTWASPLQRCVELTSLAPPLWSNVRASHRSSKGNSITIKKSGFLENIRVSHLGIPPFGHYTVLFGTSRLTVGRRILRPDPQSPKYLNLYPSRWLRLASPSLPSLVPIPSWVTAHL